MIKNMWDHGKIQVFSAIPTAAIVLIWHYNPVPTYLAVYALILGSKILPKAGN